MILKFRVLEADVMNSGPHGFRGKTIRLFREFVPQHWDRSEGSNYILLLKELAYQVCSKIASVVFDLALTHPAGHVIPFASTR
jgi:hypothetical protein